MMRGVTLRRVRLAILMAGAVAFAGLVTVIGRYWWGEEPVPTAQHVGRSLISSTFSLVDHTGKAVSAEDFHGKWQLVFFGFTFCPDVCPTTLAKVATVLDRLGADADEAVPLFITVDPERDTPEVLAKYVAAFHERIVGLTGSPAQVEAAAQSFRVYFSKVESAGAPDDYTMDHSAYVYLMDPDGEYAAHFSHTDSAETIADGIRERL